MRASGGYILPLEGRCNSSIIVRSWINTLGKSALPIRLCGFVKQRTCNEVTARDDCSATVVTRMTTEPQPDLRLPDDLSGSLRRSLTAQTLDSKRALRGLLENFNAELKSQIAAILTKKNDDQLTFFDATDDAFTQDDFPAVPIGASIAGFAFLTGQTIALDDAKTSERHYDQIDTQSGYDTREYMAIPIVHDGSTIGVLTAANRSEPRDRSMFSQSDLRLAECYADLCAVMLEHDRILRDQCEATEVALMFAVDRTIDRSQSEFGRNTTSGRQQSTAGQRKQITAALERLSERDLELVLDIAERLVAAP